ncbi:polysaccharide deacetylase family protein [Kitasatospora herbaricolor]|uniref:Polysaccharide deacetylase family protein n=1 Tax=Kitasatospora herbaricolor TaxID=68217 RepID=A0ABZ1WFE7_9ACTN|nr:polysaccharide deacetylase family protein [Kitasatospora herbaricolor]
MSSLNPVARPLPAPSRHTQVARNRRGALRSACAALLVAAVVSGCGTAQGALQASTPPSAPPVAPPGAAATSPGGPGTSEPPSAPAAPGTRPPAGSDAVPATPPGTPAPSATTAPGRPPAAPRPGSPQPAPGAPTTSAPPARPAPPPAAPGVSAALVASTAHGGRTVALTFDDGPGPATGQVLDVLAQYGAKATFCQIGPQAAANPAMVKRILAAGHRLCDHSVHHPQPFAALSHDRQVEEIVPARDMIVRAGGAGTEVPWFRAPGGGFTAANQQVAAAAGMRPLTWTVDTRDWSRPGVPAIVASVQHGLRPGGVVLMHDGGGDRSQTVAALRQLLPWLTAQGYGFDFPAV